MTDETLHENPQLGYTPGDLPGSATADTPGDLRGRATAPDSAGCSDLAAPVLAR
jgi:hypothetical protein